MLKRKMLKQLIEWKNNRDHKSLIVEGARQVGKTYIIEQFASENYGSDYFININFEKNSSMIDIFAGDLSPEAIFISIENLFRKKKFEKGKTLIFLDEIQKCPRAITALKFLSIDKRYDIIASGSLLRVSYSLVSSFPVGYVERLFLNSLDFEEFLWAKNFSCDQIDRLKEYFINKKPVPEAIHQECLKVFKDYIIVGGMPEVVENFCNTNNYQQVLKIQQRILEDYKDDIAKYANGNEKIKARQCFESIPAQLAKDYKKFQFKYVSSCARSTTYGDSIQWLVDAGIVNKCSNLSTLELPFIGYKRIDAFKIYLKDTGLLIGMLGEEAQTKLFFGELGIYKGAIYENIIADILSKLNKPLYYYEKNSSIELDFILSYEMKVCALEVKSAANTKSKSLISALNYHGAELGIKLSSKNISTTDNIINYPIYMAMFL